MVIQVLNATKDLTFAVFIQLSMSVIKAAETKREQRRGNDKIKGTERAFLLVVVLPCW